jgi:hypothetical protein
MADVLVSVAGFLVGFVVGLTGADSVDKIHVRPILISVLLISALKPLGVSTDHLGLAVLAGMAILAGWAVRHYLARRTAAPAIESIPDFTIEPV